MALEDTFRKPKSCDGNFSSTFWEDLLANGQSSPASALMAEEKFKKMVRCKERRLDVQKIKKRHHFEKPQVNQNEIKNQNEDAKQNESQNEAQKESGNQNNVNNDNKDTDKCDPRLSVSDAIRISLVSNLVKDGTNYALQRTGIQQWRDRQNLVVRSTCVVLQNYGTYYLTKQVDNVVQNDVTKKISQLPVLNAKVGFWGEILIQFGVGIVYEGVKNYFFSNNDNSHNHNNENGVANNEEIQWFISETCVICLENIDPDTTPIIGFLPCKHACLCRSCYNRNRQQFENQRFPCPLCRSTVTHICAIN